MWKTVSVHIMKWAVAALLCVVVYHASAAETSDELRAPQNFAVPDHSIYSTKEQVFKRLEKLVQANPTIMKEEDIAIPDKSTPPYNSPVKVITVEPGGHTQNHSNKIRMLLNFGEHGREMVTVEVALRLLEVLADPSAEYTQSLNRGSAPNKLRQLLHNTVFKIVPMENVRGREVVERGQLCERKNGRGVDTNRNWEVHWGFREKDYDPSEEYPGARPFSEPEAAALRAVATAFKPHVWVNAHSGMEALFLPYDHAARIPDGPGPAAALRILTQLNELACGGRCVVGSGGKSVGYLAHGTATDYMFEVLGVPLAFTWEIYGDLAAHYNDCFRMFNPVAKPQFDAVVNTWVDAIFALLELLPEHPAVQPLLHQSLRVEQKLPRRMGPEPRQKGTPLDTLHEGLKGGLGESPPPTSPLNLRPTPPLQPNVFPSGSPALMGGALFGWPAWQVALLALAVAAGAAAAWALMRQTRSCLPGAPKVRGVRRKHSDMDL